MGDVGATLGRTGRARSFSKMSDEMKGLMRSEVDSLRLEAKRWEDCMSDSLNAKIQNLRVSYQFDFKGQMQRTDSLEKASHKRFTSLEDETRKTQQDIARQGYYISECKTQFGLARQC